jgi:hypothetical protein
MVFNSESGPGRQRDGVRSWRTRRTSAKLSNVLFTIVVGGPPTNSGAMDVGHTNPTRQRGGSADGTLAGASGSSRQTATLVTLLARPVVSAEVLLELARWCQQRLTCREDGNQCVDQQLDPQSPPFCLLDQDGQEPARPPVAAVGPQHPGGSACPPDADDRTSRPNVVRKRRKGDSR